MLNLICQNCKNKLIREEETLICNVCQKSWFIEDGVPILTELSTWYPKEHIGESQFEKFLEDVKPKGWQDALQILMAGMRKPEGFQFLAFNEERDLSYLLPVSKEAVVLDYGCGVGGITFNLAKSCKWVFSIDQSILRMRFIKARCENTGISNVTPVCTGNSKYLPFPDESFDIVVLNGVLEWMPLSRAGNPYQIQMNALKEIKRVLKKGGVLYLGIENRFGYRYLFFGKGDSHNQKKKGLPYITIIPKPLAKIYSSLVIGVPYRCYLYSYFGYRRMFSKLDFTSYDFYFPYPDHNNLKYVTPIGNKKTASFLLAHILNNSSLSKKERITLSFLKKTGLLKYFAQDYSIIVTN